MSAFIVAAQMDAPELLNPRSDSTLALLEEAQERGATVYYYTPQDLSMRDGAVFSRAQRLTLDMKREPYWQRGEAELFPLERADVVLMRQDPPFDMAYITATHMLERLPPKVKVLNNPRAVRELPEKLFPLRFPQFTPPTLISASVEDIRAFHREQSEIVLKPLYGYAGRSVFVIRRDGANLEALLEALLSQSREPVVAQRFLPEVSAQEKRIVLIDGEIAGAFVRVPPEGEIRSNMRIGGMPQKTELTPRQRDICAAVGPVLKAHGLTLAGLDVIGDWLTEINITSPTGLRALEALYGTKPAAMFWDALAA